MAINNQIEILIKKLDIKKVEFAKKLRIDQSYVTKLIKGDNIPSDRLIDDICKEFGVNEDWLRSGEGDPFLKRTRNQIITDFLGNLIVEDSTFKKRLIEALAELDERDWEGLEKLANKLINKKD